MPYRILAVCCGLLLAAASCQGPSRGATVSTLKAMQSGAPEWSDAGPGQPSRPLRPGRQQVEQEAPPVPESAANWKTFGLRVGGAALTDFNTKIRLNGQLIGGEIDFEDDLGFQSDTQVFRLDAFYRFNRRHRLDLSFYDVQRSSSKQVDRELIWNGEVIPINSDTQAFIDTRIVKFTYRYSFLTTPDWELGVSLGIYGMGLNTGLSAKLNGLDLFDPRSAEFNVALPLPVIGAHAQWQFAGSFWLRFSSELFWVQLSGVGDVDDLEGYLSDTVVAVEWDFVENVGVGVGYNYFVMDVEVENAPRTLALNYGYQGLLFYGKLGF